MTRVTLKMIAEKAGTSIGTVDRALNNRAGINAESKRRVLQAAQELGYRPNKFMLAPGCKQDIHIGVAYPEEPPEFYYDIERGIDRAADELRSYGVTVEKIRYKTQSPEVAYERLSQIDPARYDGLAVNPSGAMVAQVIKRFAQAGVPVITFNTDMPDSPRLLYVGDNSRQSGLMGGELLSMLLGGRGKVTVLGNFTRTTPFVERFGGFCEHVQLASPTIQIYPCSECLSNPELAAGGLTELIRREPDINGIFCTGYSNTVGAVQALKLLNRQDIKVVGYDVTPGTAAALRDGWCDVLLYQNPYRQGHQATYLLARHILEGWQPPAPKSYIDTQVVIRSNIDRYMDLVSRHSLGSA